METSDILVRCKNWHIGPEALYIGQVRRTYVFRIDWYRFIEISEILSQRLKSFLNQISRSLNHNLKIFQRPPLCCNYFYFFRGRLAVGLLIPLDPYQASRKKKKKKKSSTCAEKKSILYISINRLAVLRDCFWKSKLSIWSKYIYVHWNQCLWDL